MGDVVELEVDTIADIPVEKVLAGAMNHDIDDVLVLGFSADGGFYIASSNASCASNLLLVETARAELLAQAWNK